MLRVVLDTNVFVSSLLVDSGQPAQVINAWRKRAFDLVISPAMTAELQQTLTYGRIRSRYAVTDEKIQKLLRLLRRRAIIVSGKIKVTGVIPQDPDDEIVLACAIEGEASLIVSGDRHLLDLVSYQGVAMITVREFLARTAVSPS